MSRELMHIKAIKDGSKVTAYIWDDGVSWVPVGSGARDALTPIKYQLALQPLTDQARAAGSSAIPFEQIHSYTWYENGQVDLTLHDARLVSFQVQPAKKAPEYMAVLHAAYVAEREQRAARKAWIAQNPS